MKGSLSFVALPALAAALPSFKGAAGSEKRQFDEALGALAGDLTGLLGSVATSVNPDNLRPEPGYEFQEPGPNDSRGPCPGLNTLANHGYLPRDGHVSFGQVLEATARGFNMGADLAGILSTFAILTDGDPVTETWYLGAGPDGLGGLNRHSTIEVDISPNREDYWLACGDNHHLSSRMFKQNVDYVKQDPNKEFSYDVMRKQYVAYPYLPNPTGNVAHVLTRHLQLRREQPLQPAVQPLDLLLPLPIHRQRRRLQLLHRILLQRNPRCWWCCQLRVDLQHRRREIR